MESLRRVLLQTQCEQELALGFLQVGDVLERHHARLVPLIREVQAASAEDHPRAVLPDTRDLERSLGSAFDVPADPGDVVGDDHVAPIETDDLLALIAEHRRERAVAVEDPVAVADQDPLERRVRQHTEPSLARLQRLLDDLPIGDVGVDPAEGVHIALHVFQWELHADPRVLDPVVEHGGELADERLTALDHEPVTAAPALGRHGIDQVEVRLADERLAVQVEQALVRSVHEDVSTVHVLHVDECG